MTKTERLNCIIEHYSGGKPSVFANFLGVAPSTISSWLARNTMDYDLVFAKCESLSPYWLLTGEGDMILSEIEDSRNMAMGSDALIDKLMDRIERQSEKIGEQRREISELKRKLQTGSDADDATSPKSALA